MSTFERVKNAESPQQALLAIAEAIDSLGIKIDKAIEHEPTPDWGTWDTQGQATPTEDPADLRAQLEAATDPDEIQALAAKLRAATDDGTNQPEDTLPEGDRVEITTGDDGQTEVVLPPPNEKQLEIRELFADEVLAKNFGWSPEECKNYLRGGPLLLYYSDREMVTQLPPLWLRQFVEDVEVNSPLEAHEMARDLLKEIAPDTQELTVENLKRDLENLHG